MFQLNYIDTVTLKILEIDTFGRPLASSSNMPNMIFWHVLTLFHDYKMKILWYKNTKKRGK